MADTHRERRKIVARKSENQAEGESPFITALENESIRVGQRLREIRATRGLSIRALAELSGLNVNTLSMIENGHTSPSVNTLQQLAQSLQIPVTTLFETDHGDKKLVYQKGANRSRVTFEHGTIENLAAGMPRFGAESIIVTIEPNADYGKKPIVHTGREFVYCIEGHVAYTVDNEKYLLEVGDSLVFEAYLPHHLKNVDASPSRILLVLCPMDDRDNPSERHFSK
jgi:transcriptional regulator with XRE-family HTH domain